MQKKRKLFFKKGLTNDFKCGIISKYENVHVALAQLDRVFGYEPKGQGFESLMPRQKRGNVSFLAFSLITAEVTET